MSAAPDIIERAEQAFAVYRGLGKKIVDELINELSLTRARCEGERGARQRCENALREKDAAMGVLFDRLCAAGVDCSDLIP